MSIKDRLNKKSEGLIVPIKGEGTSANTLRTSPGQMLMVNSLMKESNEKVALLEERVKQFEGALPARLLDPQKIRVSKWANRSASNFDSAEFSKLKSEILDANGNVQPIKVRPIAGDNENFEIVFGHRRHQACLELGVPVLALIEDVSDAELFKEMDRENRTRLDLSPWEQGMMYRRALDEKLFGSQEQLSKELGVDAGNLSKALKLASLDHGIVEAFSSPLDLQYRWAKPLAEALKVDTQGVLERAKTLKDSSQQGLSAKDVFNVLIGSQKSEKKIHTVMVDGEAKATISKDAGMVSVLFAKGSINDQKIIELQGLLEEWLKM